MLKSNGINNNSIGAGIELKRGRNTSTQVDDSSNTPISHPAIP